MSLFPEFENAVTSEEIETVEQSIPQQPTKTYYFDIETGEIRRTIDGLEAIKQFIWKAIVTERYKHVIYSDDYGCELYSIIGMSDATDEFVQSEMERSIREALIYDDRIKDVYNIKITPDLDGVFIECTVETNEGVIEFKEVI